MATYFTHDFTATNGDPWPAFTRVAGSSLANEVQSNVGWAGSVAAERFFQSDYFPTTDDYKWSLDVDFANAVTQGRYFGMAVRLTDDGNTCYWVQISSHRMSDSTMNMPHLRIYRRRSGTDTEIVTEQDISGTVSGADLNGGQEFTLRVENTDENTVNIKVFADATELYSYDDTAANRISSGGTIGIVTGSGSVNDDVTFDNATAKDFADEATGGAAPTTGLAIMLNGSHYNEEEIEDLGIAGLTATQSYAIGPTGTARDINDFHLPVLRPGDDIAIRYNDVYYASGVLRPVVQDGLIPEGNTYEIHGPKMLAKGVPIAHPTTNQGQLLFNADPEDPEYDADLDGMSPGDILAWLYDNHADGQDGLRAHKAAPASGTIATIPAGLTNGPVIPGITVSGDFAAAVEFVLSYMPQYAWHIDPETRAHSFHDRDAASSQDVDAADDHVFVRLETKPSQNRTAVIIRGGKPEVEIETLKLSDGTLEGKWDSTGEGTYTNAKSKINRIEGTLSGFGQYSGDPTYGDRIYVDPDQSGGLFVLDTDVANGNWAGTFLNIQMTTHGSFTFQVYANTSSRLILTSVDWPSGGTFTPTIGDSINLFGSRQKQSTVEGDIEGENQWGYDAYRTFGKTGGGRFAEGECFQVTLKIPQGTNEDSFEVHRVGGTVKGGNLELDAAATLPVGLVNYLPGRNGGCGAGEAQGVGQGGLGDIEVEAPIQQTVVPYVRVPTNGFRGTAYAFDSSKWNGGGEPGVGDPGVITPLVIDDPNFQYQTQQESDYIALADAMLKVFGTLSVMAQVQVTDSIDSTWLGLEKKVTISDTESGRTTGYESSEDLWVAAVTWDFDKWATTVNIGNMAAFGGVNIQAVRQRFAENQRIKQFRDFIKRQQEILNCLKDGFQQSKGSEITGSQQPCASDIKTSGGSTVEDRLNAGAHSLVGAGGSAAAAVNECTDQCGLIDSSSAAANAADAIAKGPALAQPSSRGTLGGADKWIEESVACNQTHINGLWNSMKALADATGAALGNAQLCLNNADSDRQQLNTRITCVIDDHNAFLICLHNYINTTLIPCIQAGFGMAYPGPGFAWDCDPLDCDDMECPSPTLSLCLALCECNAAFATVTCNA